MFSPSQTHNNITVFGSPRSGSTFVFHNIITGLVSEYPEYSTEFNHRRYGSEPFRRNNDMRTRWNIFPKSYCVSKFHLIDLLNANEMGWWHEINQNSHYNILLLRKNFWESALSLAISTYKNQWINDLDDTKVTIDTPLFLNSLDVQIRNINHLWGDNDFNIKPDQIIFTEELTDNPSDLYESITGNRLVLENTVKKSPDKESVIVNLSELRSAYEQADKDLHGRATLEGDMVNYNE